MAINKVAYEFNPFKETGISVPKDKRKEALKEVANFVKEQVLSYVGDGKSPVKGGKWTQSLTESYKKVKAKTSSVDYANLELNGDMLDELEVEVINSQRLSLKIEGDEAGKADGNNRGTYGQKQTTGRKREFIPKDGQTFKSAIWDGVKDILKEYEDASED